jgi:hypothetical protein
MVFETTKGIIGSMARVAVRVAVGGAIGLGTVVVVSDVGASKQAGRETCSDSRCWETCVGEVCWTSCREAGGWNCVVEGTEEGCSHSEPC